MPPSAPVGASTGELPDRPLISTVVLMLILPVHAPCCVNVLPSRVHWPAALPACFCFITMVSPPLMSTVIVVTVLSVNVACRSGVMVRPSSPVMCTSVTCRPGIAALIWLSRSRFDTCHGLPETRHAASTDPVWAAAVGWPLDPPPGQGNRPEKGRYHDPSLHDPGR